VECYREELLKMRANQDVSQESGEMEHLLGILQQRES
jgi:hypothetical protein